MEVDLSKIEIMSLLKLIKKEIEERYYKLPFPHHKSLVTADNKLIEAFNNYQVQECNEA